LENPTCGNKTCQGADRYVGNEQKLFPPFLKYRRSRAGGSPVKSMIPANAAMTIIYDWVENLSDAWAD
jgi:hypothetical protein